MDDGFKEKTAGGRHGNNVRAIRKSAKMRRVSGIGMMTAGGCIACSLFIGGLCILAAASAFAPTAIAGELLADELELAEAAGEFAEEFGGAALTVMRTVGAVMEAAAAGFCCVIAAGWQRVRAGRVLSRVADDADEASEADGIDIASLASQTQTKTHKMLKTLRKYINRGWLTAWLDEPGGKIYLTAESWRAARRASPKQGAQPGSENKEDAGLVAARRFEKELEAARGSMKDEQAAEELEKMQKTTSAICSWLETHPESMPKARRFAEYYIPTTLKLLSTYSDVQGQRGDSAEAIRRDIAGILHTLNQAYTNLYDKLLSDAALDISGEIAALQGMLASDGLTGEGLV